MDATDSVALMPARARSKSALLEPPRAYADDMGGRAIAVWLFVSLVSCSSGDTGGMDECGPNGECPSGYECEARTRRCVVIGSTAADARPADAVAPADAPLAADAPPLAPDAPLIADAPPAPDAPLTADALLVPDARPPDARPPDARPPDAGPPVFLGPLAYLRRTDGPFEGLTFTTFYLEDFEDSALNTPGVTASSNTLSSASGTSLIDSVDEDDGSVNGTCQAGCDALFGAGSITFTFDAATLGGLPTHAGVVWTDGGYGATVKLEAFDAAGISLGSVSGSGFPDSVYTGGTAEDRFFGVIAAAGIKKITISNTVGGIEVDHLQYGR
jgi:hypothetical protein